MAQRWGNAGATRLHLVDLDGAKSGRPVNVDCVRRITATVGVPCQFGGGIRDEAGIRLMLEDVGIERVIVGTQALKQPEWFAQMAVRFPNRLVLGIDARNGMVATEGWLEVSQTPAFELARQFVGLDLAAVVFTNIANDGMLAGIDDATLADLERLAGLGLRVIASGGVTTLDDVRTLAAIARRQPNLVGAIVGRAIYEGRIDLATSITTARNADHGS
jgi:phosphoribosylformimino-5-aminoimidazole carboxamide ribotide isomerase